MNVYGKKEIERSNNRWSDLIEIDMKTTGVSEEDAREIELSGSY